MFQEQPRCTCGSAPSRLGAGGVGAGGSDCLKSTTSRDLALFKSVYIATGKFLTQMKVRRCSGVYYC